MCRLAIHLVRLLALEVMMENLFMIASQLVRLILSRTASAAALISSHRQQWFNLGLTLVQIFFQLVPGSARASSRTH